MEGRELLLAWAHGWSVSRRRPTPVPVLRGVRIDAAEHSGAPRFVLPTLDELRTAGPEPGWAARDTEVKVLATGARLRNWTGDGWSTYPACELMSIEFAPRALELHGS